MKWYSICFLLIHMYLLQEEVGEEPILVMVDSETGQHVPIVKHSESQEMSSSDQQITFIETGEDHETVKTMKREEVNPTTRSGVHIFHSTPPPQKKIYIYICIWRIGWQGRKYHDLLRKNAKGETGVKYNCWKRGWDKNILFWANIHTPLHQVAAEYPDSGRERIRSLSHGPGFREWRWKWHGG